MTPPYGPIVLAVDQNLQEDPQAPVIDMYGRMNFPWRHPLNQTRSQADKIGEADVILGLELTDFWGVTNGRLAPGAKRISITAGDLYLKANYQDFERFTPVDIAIAADAEATLPYLIEAVRKATTAGRRSVFKARGTKLAQDHQAALVQSREAAAVGWDAQPITTARM